MSEDEKFNSNVKAIEATLIKYRAALYAIQQRANERAAGNDFIAERDTVYAMHKIATEALK